MRTGWKLLVGGNGGGKPRLSRELARDLTDEQALECIDKIVAYFKANAKKHQRLGAMIEKMGFDEFKVAVSGGQQ
jgi:NAD(P)H-nitrite reductase large subunit